MIPFVARFLCRSTGRMVSLASEYVTRMSLRFRASIQKATRICPAKREKEERARGRGRRVASRTARMLCSFRLQSKNELPFTALEKQL